MTYEILTDVQYIFLPPLESIVGFLYSPGQKEAVGCNNVKCATYGVSHRQAEIDTVWLLAGVRLTTTAITCAVVPSDMPI